MKLSRYSDSHVHIELFEEKDREKTRSLLDLLYEKGVTDANILSFLPGCDIISNLNVLYWKNNYTKIKLRAFGAFHENDYYKCVPYEKQYERLMALGCDGIKFIQMKPDRRKLLGKGICDPSYDRALYMMEDDGTPVTVHSGDPQVNWDPNVISPSAMERGWFYGDGTFPSCEQLYHEVFEMLDKHPRLNVTFAHFFFLSDHLDGVRRIFEKYPNVKFDITPGGEMFVGFSKRIDEWHDFFEENSDRILYGTDCNDIKRPSVNAALVDAVREVLYHGREEYLLPIYSGYTVRGLDLSQKSFENIMYSDYIRFVGEDVKPVDCELFRETAEVMYSELKDDPKYEKSVLWLSKFI